LLKQIISLKLTQFQNNPEKTIHPHLSTNHYIQSECWCSSSPFHCQIYTTSSRAKKTNGGEATAVRNKETRRI